MYTFIGVRKKVYITYVLVTWSFYMVPKCRINLDFSFDKVDHTGVRSIRFWIKYWERKIVGIALYMCVLINIIPVGRIQFHFSYNIVDDIGFNVTVLGWLH